MNDILLEAFRHSAWATKALAAAGGQLSAEQLGAPGRSFGSILATLHHIVWSDADYAAILGAERPAWLTGAGASGDLSDVETRADQNLRSWETILASSLDPERGLVLDEGKYECHASVVVAQALHHAAAHREQVRARLAEVGVEAPDVQPWEYALATGRARWTGVGD